MIELTTSGDTGIIMEDTITCILPTRDGGSKIHLLSGNHVYAEESVYEVKSIIESEGLCMKSEEVVCSKCSGKGYYNTPDLGIGSGQVPCDKCGGTGSITIRRGE